MPTLRVPLGLGSPGRRLLLTGLLALLAICAYVGSALVPAGSTDKHGGGVLSLAPKHVHNPLAGRIEKVVGTTIPAKRYGEEIAALEDQGENLAGERISQLSPLPAGAFDTPVGEYKAYAQVWISHTDQAARTLEGALASGSRSASERDWKTAWSDYLRLGTGYDLFGKLNEEIDGVPGRLTGGPSNPAFIGLHRIEWGLWTGRDPRSLVRYSKLLQTDLARLHRMVPGVRITPLEYANRSHEIIEDAQRDLLNSMDVPWSHAGVLGTAAGLAADEELFHTLEPLLSGRENTEGEVANKLSLLRGLFAEIRRHWHGGYPSTLQMGTYEHEQLNGYVAGALSALQEMPATLETELYRPPPKIPKSR